MQRDEINKILDNLNKAKERNIVIVDFGNVEKWKKSLGWKIGIRELGNLVKHLSKGKKFLRRFYYGSDFGPKEKSITLSLWSDMVLNKAKMSNFEVITKRVKYIADANYRTGFIKKCNFDIDISIDLIEEIDNYDRIILFSGDGDFGRLLEYLSEEYDKKSIVFGTRWHVGRELYDAKSNGAVTHILYAEDFEYRLDMDRFRR